ncbi:hypothetical protein [Morganella morganii]|uniref:hypothetical protein n=1 Tax=Morganella morganii TaxID=582 RepID=UPI003D7FAB8E
MSKKFYIKNEKISTRNKLGLAGVVMLINVLSNFSIQLDLDIHTKEVALQHSIILKVQ